MAKKNKRDTTKTFFWESKLKTERKKLQKLVLVWLHIKQCLFYLFCSLHSTLLPNHLNEKCILAFMPLILKLIDLNQNFEWWKILVRFVKLFCSIWTFEYVFVSSFLCCYIANTLALSYPYSHQMKINVRSISVIIKQLKLREGGRPI